MAGYTSTHTGQEIDAYATKQQLINLIYPVGSIYISINSTSPATLFGGTWEQITGRFLIGAGSCASQNSDNYFGTIKNVNSWNPGLGSTGGEDYHILTENEMPQHHHIGIYWADPGNPAAIITLNGGTYGYKLPFSGTVSTTAGAGANETSMRTGYRGNNYQHNNMPPYLAVNIWKRTA